MEQKRTTIADVLVCERYRHRAAYAARWRLLLRFDGALSSGVSRSLVASAHG